MASFINVRNVEDYRIGGIFKRHLSQLRSDKYFYSSSASLGYRLSITNVADFSPTLRELQNTYIPALVTNNLRNALERNPVAVIGVCLVPRGRVQILWSGDKERIALDLFLAYKEIFQSGKKEILTENYKHLLLSLCREVKPQIYFDVEHDPTMGRIIKYLHQLEQIFSLGISEAHFILPVNLYANTYIENATKEGLPPSDINKIYSLIASYGERERHVINSLMREFFPDLVNRVKVIIPSDETYIKGIKLSEGYTELLKQAYLDIPVEHRAMSAYAISQAYEDIDITAMRLWLSNSMGEPISDRGLVILAHIKNFKPTSRFLLQSLLSREHVEKYQKRIPSPIALVLSSSGPSIFHRTKEEQTLYWDTERQNDDDYSALPEQGIRIGDGKLGTLLKFANNFRKETNRSSRQSRIFWILYEVNYFLSLYNSDRYPKELKEEITSILDEWDDPANRNYEKACELTAEIVDIFRDICWKPLC